MINKAMNEVAWLANELENPSLTLDIEKVMPSIKKLLVMKNDCKEVFKIEAHVDDKDRVAGCVARLRSFLLEAENAKAVGQEGTPMPADFSIVLGNSLECLLQRVIH